MCERFLGALPSPPAQHAAPGSIPESVKGYSGGRRVTLDEAELEKTNVRMIISTLEPENSVGTPKELPLHLLFLRMLFDRLREHEHCPAEEDPAMERLPVDAFRRAFERLLFLLSDPRGFDDGDTYATDGNGLVGWDEFFQVQQRRNLRIRLSLCERVFLTLESPDPADAPLLARAASFTVLAVVVLSSCVTVLATLPEMRGVGGRPEGPSARLLIRIDEACLMLFCVEYAIRLVTCWAVRSELFDRACLLELVASHEPILLPSAFGRLLRFIATPANLVDLAAILPGVVAFFVETDGNGLVVLRLVRLTRIFRALKNPALVEPVVVIARTIEQSTMALYFLLFNLLLGIVVFGSLMYLVEGQGTWDTELQTYMRRARRRWNITVGAWEDVLEPSPFRSIPHTFWWAVVTTAQVGYGDHYPTTFPGYAIAALTMAFSLVVSALPIGLIGATFDRVWEAYAKEKLAQGEALKRDIGVVASAIQRLDPARISNLMLIEVWNDRGDSLGPLGPRGSKGDFMGEAKLQLELPADKPVSRRLTVPLEANNELVARGVSGSITLAYTWMPHSLDAHVEDGSRSKRSSQDSDVVQWGSVARRMQPRGRLEVSIISGDHLINLEGNRKLRLPSPFCLVFAYATCPDLTGAVEPCVWRTSTASRTLRPRWHANHRFDFTWNEPRGLIRTWSTSRILSGRSLSPASSWPTRRASADVGEVVALIRELAREVHLVREELRELADRVNRVAGQARGCGTPEELCGKVQGLPEDSAAPMEPIKASLDELRMALGDLER